MLKITRFFASIFVFLALMAIFSTPVRAEDCDSPYGGGTPCPATGQTVDKRIFNPATGEWVDGLGPSNDINTRFRPGQEMLFKITVKNTGQATINRVIVEDRLPPFTDFVSGDGNFDAAARKFTYTIDNLESGKIHEANVRFKAFAAERLPAGSFLLCSAEGVVNRVSIWADGRQATDETPICIGSSGQTGIGSVVSAPGRITGSESQLVNNGRGESTAVLRAAPKAGTEDVMLGIAFLGILALGIYLQQKVKVVSLR